MDQIQQTAEPANELQEQGENANEVVNETNEYQDHHEGVEEADGQESEAEQETPKYDQKQIEEIQRKTQKSINYVLKKDKEIRQEKAQLKQHKETLEKFNKFAELKDSNPLEALQHLGLDFQQVAEYVLKTGQPEKKDSNYSKLEQEIERLKQEREEEKQQAQTKKQQTVINEYQSSLKSIAESNPEQYGYTLDNWDQAKDAALEIVKVTYQQTGKAPTNKQVMDHMENYFEKKYEQRVLKNPKFNARYKLTPNEKKALEAQENEKASEVGDLIPQEEKTISEIRQRKTLNNRIQAGKTPRAPRTEQERRQAALAVLKFTD